MTAKKKGVFIGILVLLMVFSLLAAIYPIIASWSTARSQAQVRTQYQEQMNETDHSELEAIWAAAEEYNQKLFNGEISPGEAPYQAGYYDMLNLTGTGLMGYIEIPKIDVNLPIYHTVEETVLSKGAGHMPQSSLPVGGENTHAAISAHTGLASAPMFTELIQMEVGDVFYISTLGVRLAYEVEEVLTVDPSDVSHIQIQRERDLVTLITCTPYGINSHRLLVRGHRIELTEGLVLEQQMLSQQTEESSVYWRHYIGGIFDGLTAAGLLLLLAIASLTIRKHISRKKKIKEELLPC